MPLRWGRLYKGTKAEHALEPAVAALGLCYRTQFPGYLYGFRAFPDFFLPQLGLVIEVDDPSHDRPDKRIEDQERTEILESFGWRVVRCKNEEALNDPSGTVQSLMAGAGITRQDIERAATRPLAECLPVPKSAPQASRRSAQKAKRAVAAARRKAQPVKGRSTRRQSRSRPTRQAQASVPPPTQVPSPSEPPKD